MERNEAEIMRIRYKYRRLIMEGKVALPYRDAARLIGPDAAFHLYGKGGSDGKHEHDGNG